MNKSVIITDHETTFVISVNQCDIAELHRSLNGKGKRESSFNMTRGDEDIGGGGAP